MRLECAAPDNSGSMTDRERSPRSREKRVERGAVDGGLRRLRAFQHGSLRPAGFAFRLPAKRIRRQNPSAAATTPSSRRGLRHRRSARSGRRACRHIDRWPGSTGRQAPTPRRGSAPLIFSRIAHVEQVERALSSCARLRAWRDRSLDAAALAQHCCAARRARSRIFGEASGARRFLPLSQAKPARL